jgi:hypothetical protein
MAEQMEYPQVYRNEDGAELIAMNDVQGAAFENNGFQPAGKYVAKQSKSKTEE